MSDIKSSTDEELIKIYLSGDERGFDEIYSRYEARLKRLIYYYVGDPDDVNDVFHEVVIRVVKHIKTYNSKRAFSSWIYQIAVNCSKNYIKKSRRDMSLIEKEKFRLSCTENQEMSPEERIINDQDMKEFNAAVESLSDKFRDVFILRYDQNMKYSDISGVLNCSERTAKWRMERAVEKITRYLRNRGIV